MPVPISQRVRGIPPSGLVPFFDLLSSMDDVLSLGIGEPDLPAPQPVAEAGIATIASGSTGYTCNAGVAALRRAIASMLGARYGVTYDPETEILITVGVSEALLVAALALLDPGQAVLLPEPSFVAYDPIVRCAGGVPLPVHTTAAGGFEVTIEALERAWDDRAVALLLSYPSNPTGAVMPRARLQAVVEWATERDLVVLSDEIYDRFVYGVSHTCVPTLSRMRDRTLLLGGFSKAYAMTGWRVGYACGPRELIEAMHVVHQYAVMSAPTIGRNGERWRR